MNFVKKRIEPNPAFKALFMAKHPHPETVETWALLVDGKEYHAIVSRDPVGVGRKIPDDRWHISVSAKNEVPPWQVMAAVGHELRPGVPFVIGVPPKSWWINVHEFTLHLWELKDQNLLDQWRSERRGDGPT